MADEITEQAIKQLDKNGWLANIADIIYSYNVYAFAHEKKWNDRTVTHVVVEFFAEDFTFAFEWGNASNDVMNYNEELQTYYYPNQSWFGKVIEENKDKSKLKKTLLDVVIVSELWKQTFGKGGHYPKNCRGYVDFTLRNLFNEQVNWTAYKIDKLKQKSNLLDSSKPKEIK
jgi:hypothetical protein